MSFNSNLKQEIITSDLTFFDTFALLDGFIRSSGVIGSELDDYFVYFKVSNYDYALYIVKVFETSFNISATISQQKNTYLVTFNKVKQILESLNIIKNSEFVELSSDFYQAEFERKSFVRGLFLLKGSINDPTSNQYHLEMVINQEELAKEVINILRKFNFKVMIRRLKYCLYLKNSLDIANFVGYLDCPNSMFKIEETKMTKNEDVKVLKTETLRNNNYNKSKAYGLEQIALIANLNRSKMPKILNDIIAIRLKTPTISYLQMAKLLSKQYNKVISKSSVAYYHKRLYDYVS
jgi:DNA-binding protein WhiA